MPLDSPEVATVLSVILAVQNLLTKVGQYSEQHQDPGNDTDQYSKSDNKQNSCQHNTLSYNPVLEIFLDAN